MFDIKKTADSLHLKYVKEGVDKSLYYVCPFCSDKDGHLNLNTKTNVWRCNHCGEGGGVLDLIERVLDIDRTAAKQFLKNSDLFLSGNDAYQKRNEIQQENKNSFKIASEERLDFVYRSFLSLLSLKEEHKQELLKRGLSEKAIKTLMFRSLPENENVLIPRKLMKMGCVLEGIPGFYKEKNCWKINAFPAGYLIPFINQNGKITGFQIHNDNPCKKHGKYMSFASLFRLQKDKPAKMGTKSNLSAHLIGYHGQKMVGITEGALKADIASFLYYKLYKKKIAIIAIPGVSNYKKLAPMMEYLKKNGVEEIVDLFDMDKIGNENTKCNEDVKKALEKIKQTVEQSNLKWISSTWKKEKGIDDYLLQKYNEKKESCE